MNRHGLGMEKDLNLAVKEGTNHGVDPFCSPWGTVAPKKSSIKALGKGHGVHVPLNCTVQSVL